MIHNNLVEILLKQHYYGLKLLIDDIIIKNGLGFDGPEDVLPTTNQNIMSSMKNIKMEISNFNNYIAGKIITLNEMVVAVAVSEETKEYHQHEPAVYPNKEVTQETIDAAYPEWNVKLISSNDGVATIKFLSRKSS